MRLNHYDDYDPYLDEHHPTCKGGCNQLADECMCNWSWSSAMAYDSDIVLSVKVHDEEPVAIDIVRTS